MSSRSGRFATVLCLFAAAVASARELKFPTTNPAGTLRTGDVVEFTVHGLYGPGVATPLVVRVDEKGKVKLPMVDEVAVAGQTNDAAGPLIAKAYEDAQIMSRGGTSVTVAIVAVAAQMPIKPGPLAAGDTVRVTIFELTGPGQRTEVDAAVAPDGTITMPIAGKVKIAGATDADAARAIAKAYKDGRIISNPSVLLLRTASGS